MRYLLPSYGILFLSFITSFDSYSFDIKSSLKLRNLNHEILNTSPVAGNNILFEATPLVTSQPENSIICSGESTSFSISAEDAIAFKWQVNVGDGFVDVTNNSVFSGASTSLLSITNATADYNGYQFRCVVSGDEETETISNIVTLTVNGVHSISSGPQDVKVCSGEDVEFTVVAQNAKEYQWQVDMGMGFANVPNIFPYTGVNSSTLTIIGANVNYDTFKYQVIISGSCSPAITSAAATLSINALPTINSDPSDQSVCLEEDAQLMVSGGGTGTIYQWQVDDGSGFEDLLESSIYSGVNTSILNITAAPVSLNGYQYRAVVYGECLPEAYSNPAALTVNIAPEVLKHPENTRICPGAEATFAVEASSGKTYQWQINTGAGFVDLSDNMNYANTSSSTLSVLNGVEGMDGYKFRVIVNGFCSPPAISDEAVLSVNKTPNIFTQPTNTSVCKGENAIIPSVIKNASSFKWQINKGSGFIDLIDTGAYAGTNTDTLKITNASSLMHGFTFRCIAVNECSATVTSNVVSLTINKVPEIEIQPSNKTVCGGVGTSFTVKADGTGLEYHWQVDDGSGFVDLEENEFYSGVSTPSLSILNTPTTINGNMYRVIIAGVCSPSITSNGALLTVNKAPVILTQPKNTAVCGGNNTIVSLVAENATGYQWQVDKGFGFSSIVEEWPYSGSTTSQLSITGSTPGMDGFRYRCLASGGCAPSASSNIITLSVSNMTVASINNDITCQGAQNGSIELTPSQGIGAYTYHWSNGATTQNIYNLTAGDYSVEIKDESNCVVSASFSIAEPDALFAFASVTPLHCENGDNAAINVTVIGGTKPYSYQWSNDKITEDLTNLSAGSYTLVVTDANNCQNTTTFIVENPSPMEPVSLKIPTNKICIVENPVKLEGGYPEGGVYSGFGVENGMFDPIVAGTGSHVIKYTYTDPFNCYSGFTTDTVFVSVCNSISPTVVLSPNITEGKSTLKIENSSGGEVMVRVRNMEGKLQSLQKFNAVEGNQDIELDLSSISSGVYIVEIQIGNFISQRRLIKR